MRDALDLDIATSSRACVDALDAARASLLGFRADMALHAKAALAADQDCVLAHVLRGSMSMLLSNVAALDGVDRSIAAASRSAARATPREALHLEALRCWRAGLTGPAIAAWEAILRDHPRDLLALRLSHFAYFWSAADPAGMRASIERVLPAWGPGVPGRGWVLGMHGFACEETGELGAAEIGARAALEANPSDLWSVHALAHVLEMAARHGEGDALAEHGAPHLAGATNFRFHLAWHRALSRMELGAGATEMLRCYDEAVRDLSSPLVQGQPDLYIDVQNAASLLLRLELAGVDPGDRWAELADRAEARIGDHLVVFTLPHWMMALAAAGRWDACERLLDAMRAHGAASTAEEAGVVARVAIPAARCVRAHRRGEFAAALDALFALRHEIPRLGGSHAQRDLLWQVMADAAWRAGRMAELSTILGEVATARAPHPVPGFYRRLAARGVRRSAGRCGT
jgi:hypothetical protein